MYDDAPRFSEQTEEEDESSESAAPRKPFLENNFLQRWLKRNEDEKEPDDDGDEEEKNENPSPLTRFSKLFNQLFPVLAEATPVADTTREDYSYRHEITDTEPDLRSEDLGELRVYHEMPDWDPNDDQNLEMEEDQETDGNEQEKNIAVKTTSDDLRGSQEYFSSYGSQNEPKVNEETKTNYRPQEPRSLFNRSEQHRGNDVTQESEEPKHTSKKVSITKKNITKKHGYRREKPSQAKERIVKNREHRQEEIYAKSAESLSYKRQTPSPSVENYADYRAPRSAENHKPQHEVTSTSEQTHDKKYDAKTQQQEHSEKLRKIEMRLDDLNDVDSAVEKTVLEAEFDRRHEIKDYSASGKSEQRVSAELPPVWTEPSQSRPVAIGNVLRDYSDTARARQKKPTETSVNKGAYDIALKNGAIIGVVAAIIVIIIDSLI